MPCRSVNSFTISVVRSHFAQQRRALGVRVAAQFLHQRDHAIGLLQIRAELGLERDVRQIVHAIGELLLLIDVPEEPRVVEAGLAARAHCRA